MCVLEVSVLRSRTPRALWCAVTVHGRHPAGAATGRPSAALAAPDGWLFATGVVRAAAGPGSCAAGVTVGPASVPWPQDAPAPVRRLARRLVSHVRREAATTPRWYLLAEAEEKSHPGVLGALRSLGAALAEHPCHQQATEALTARAPLTVLCSGLVETPCRSAPPVERSGYRQLLLDRIGQLAYQGLGAPEITGRLGQEGFTLAPGRVDGIGLATVQRLLREDVRPTTPIPTRNRPRPAPGEAPGTDEWWLPDLAIELSMPISTLYSWVRRGWVTAVRKETCPPYRWIVRAGPADLGELRRRRARTAKSALGEASGPAGAVAPWRAGAADEIGQGRCRR
ncbi:hypothetical protein GCM10010317_095450 [Streptomyces mirabilis]|uniref:hypothetical protein n=1 Tax=Streptomyces mirabilis TaxID=68239 RepID=UPI00167C5C0B|nr:hypothetical protein [Streptomyces mirabilis]GHD77464.1 hypothetical protein GCM10010317_095450 [Streptomyces mirabilis]